MSTLSLQKEVCAQIAPELMQLLLLADPSEQFVKSYLAKGNCYSYWENEKPIATFVLVPLSKTEIEIKNIAVQPDKQGKGLGKQLLKEAIRIAKTEGYTSLYIGTGNSSIGQMALYQKMGFEMHRILHGFFEKAYSEPIFENGIQCKHMLLLKQEL